MMGRMILSTLLVAACSSSDDSAAPDGQPDVIDSADTETSVDTSVDISADTGEGDVSTPGEPVVNVPNPDGSTTTSIDASDAELWIGFDLDTGLASDESGSWDLAFRRANIRVNGGTSGSAGVQVAIVPGTDFETVSEAPASGYLTDQADSDDEDSDPDYAFLADGAWYEYDLATHTLTPRARVYVIQSSEGAWFKLQILDYYRDGDGGYPVFQWAPVAAPSATEGWVVDASSGLVYVNLAAQSVVESADPSDDTSWDLAFDDARILTNGGTSGSGFGGARPSSEAWEALSSSDTVGFEVDELLAVPGPPGSGTATANGALGDWYEYDPSTHVLSPKATSFVVRAADGDFFKLRILAWDGGVYTLEAAPLDRAVAVHSTTFVAGEWSRLSFSQGTMVTDESWDLGANETQLQTNGGTSGDGIGGALATDASGLDQLAEVPRSGCYLAAAGHVCKCELSAAECADQSGAWTPQCGCDVEPVVDSMLPLPGPPGSGEASGNPVLAEWYDYDPSTHAVSPKAAVYLVRGADGNWAKLQVTDYVDGVLTIDWAWTGPGRFDF